MTFDQIFHTLKLVNLFSNYRYPHVTDVPQLTGLPDRVRLIPQEGVTLSIQCRYH